MHATLHAKLEICAMLAIVEGRKSLFPWILGFSDHPHTVEVAASNPAPSIRLVPNLRRNVGCRRTLGDDF